MPLDAPLRMQEIPLRDIYFFKFKFKYNQYTLSTLYATDCRAQTFTDVAILSPALSGRYDV
jgi:hypothetical protein